MSNSNILTDKIEAEIVSVVPDFENQPEDARGEAMFNFYELSKRDGLNLASALIDGCGPLINQLGTQLGQQNQTFKRYSDKFVDSAATLILMQVNGNLGISIASDLNQFQKTDLTNQNAYAISLVNKLERFYKNPETQSSITSIKNKIGGSEQRVNPSTSCYIATLVYGGYDCYQVCILREYRDSRLIKTGVGRLLVRTYYRSNKILFPVFKHSSSLQRVARFFLNFFIEQIGRATI